MYPTTAVSNLAKSTRMPFTGTRSPVSGSLDAWMRHEQPVDQAFTQKRPVREVDAGKL